MEPNAFKTEEEYEAALKEMERLFEVEEKASVAEQIENLLILIEAYEDRHYPISQPNLVYRILYFLQTRRFFHQ